MIKTITKTLILTFLIGLANELQAQNNDGEIRGTVTDSKTKDVLISAYIHLQLDGATVESAVTDIDGRYYFKGIEPNIYSIVCTYGSSGYDTTKRINVKVNPGQNTTIDISMSKGAPGNTPHTVITGVRNGPIFTKGADNQEIGRKKFRTLGTPDLNRGLAILAGVNLTTNGQLSINGQRPDGTVYYEDGVKVNGSYATNISNIYQMDVFSAGIPAIYGDFTGGVVNIVTRGPSRRWMKSFEVISSQPLDAYNHNSIEGYLSGPLLMKYKGDKEKERLLMGFSLSGNLRHRKDRSPSAIGIYKTKDDVARSIASNPLIRNGDALVHSGNYLTFDDLENTKARTNSAALDGIISGKLQFKPGKNTLITAYGSYNFFNGNTITNNILNLENTPKINSTSIRTYLAFKQKFKANQMDTSIKRKGVVINNAYYTVRLDYQSTQGKRYEDKHKDRLFEYGYIGSFNSYNSEAYSYKEYDNAKEITDQNGNKLYVKSFYEHTGYRDTAITFNASALNPSRANYTKNVYETFGENGSLNNALEIESFGGLLNGQNALNLYSLYQTPGFINSRYSESQNEKVTLFAMGEAQIQGTKKNRRNKPHDIQFGLQFEQNSSRAFSANAASLWTLMPQLANRHLELDLTNPIASYDQNGIFQDTIRYKTLVNESQQSAFDKNFRAKLIKDEAVDIYGKPINKTTRLDVNSYSPEDFDLSLLSADELLNNGNPLISYYGYDHTGKKNRAKHSIQDFINDPENRSIGAFQPIYTAAWIQDKFILRDLVLRMGVRFERYDANQPVLKDPYSLFPIKTAGEVKELAGDQIAHPQNIGKDFKVYVNDINAPTKIMGYRDGSQWYDENGTELNNGRQLEEETTTNSITPLLVDPTNQKITAETFEDYKPEIKVLPRLWFSFPINDEAVFFASYDVLTQRPSEALSRFAINDYYFMEEKSNSIFSNPALKQRLKTNYEIGFKKKISKKSALSIVASYSELRNDVNQFKYNYSYPITEGYVSYNNIDFSTTKGMKLEYINRGERNFSFNANYTLLFANGTGTSAASQSALIQAGIDNLRNTLPLGEYDIRHTLKAVITASFPETDKKRRQVYNGPTIGKWDVLKNTTATAVFSARSGLPYSKITKAVQSGTVERSNLAGQPFSSRLPWQYSLNLNFNKTYKIKAGKPSIEGQKYMKVNAFIYVSNVLNLKNVNRVYSYTGNSEDDGFLNSPQGKLVVENAINAQSFFDLYTNAINNPGNYNAPRQAKMGLRFNL